jgi:hypothetical protein
MEDLTQMCDRNRASELLAGWLMGRVISSARGDGLSRLDVEPEGRFWLGRLTSETDVINAPFGDRSERMAPCAVGFRIRPQAEPPWIFTAFVAGCAWHRERLAGNVIWRKTAPVRGRIDVEITSRDLARNRLACLEFEEGMRRELGVDVLRASVRVDVERGRGDRLEIVVSFVNESPDQSTALADTGIYEARLRVEGIETMPFLLESLPDSFRYDRRVPAYGINCGVEAREVGVLESTDVVTVDRPRPRYWAVDEPPPDFRFVTLSLEPLESLHQLVSSHRAWGNQVWSETSLNERMERDGWSPEMRAEANQARMNFEEEADRLQNGMNLLESNPDLLICFRMMNEAMLISSRGRYEGWRPFQVGFLLANLPSVLGRSEETSVVDILWFATGGGKTETYLGLLVMAAFHDRLRGKSCGITAWSRFPLRLLSLQQTQRFADAIAAAETVRRLHGLTGAPFSLGFFVGDSSTPNRIKNEPGPGEPDPLDESMPARYQVLLRCPFCDGALQMGFNRRTWRLEHRCSNQHCSWPDEALPFYIVDEEIYRVLPTVVVGTLDKVALISMQAAMRGFVASPYGLCSEPHHGFVYARRSDKPTGCLVPGCRGQRLDLPIPAEMFTPSFRLQDELHLLRDSLGAIDSHYESLLDELQFVTSRTRPKVVASSATLTGYQRQCDVLYRRQGRVFPIPGPSVAESFWSADTPNLLRRFIALAPRGATLEYAVDRILTVLQESIRTLNENPDQVCQEIGVDSSFASHLVSLYGTNVVYGNTVRDIDASVRSLETQVPVSPLHTAQLTGQTQFDHVRAILDRLQSPEAEFGDRIHVVAASSMMSHGVDVDRLNSMLMLGLPLTTAEFIQATSRIGRAWPGLVFVLHKMALERDASVFRSFRSYVEQGDRFVEAIPITRRSRRVLERTIPGIVMARIRHIYEPASPIALTLIERVRRFYEDNGISVHSEVDQIVELLQYDSAVDAGLIEETRRLLALYFRNLHDPPNSERFPDKLFSVGVMRSLRDVEEQAAVHD